MKIGIIGTGKIGSNLARLFVAAGHEVILSWSRSPEKLILLSLELGNHHHAKAASVAEAVQDTDLCILSIHFAILDDVKKQMGDVEGKIIVDPNNRNDIRLPDGVSAASELQRRLPGTRLVKAFSTLHYTVLVPHSHTNPLTAIPLSGNDEDAKNTVKKLITDIGFAPFDIGGLHKAPLQERGGAFCNKALTLQQAKELKKNMF